MALDEALLESCAADPVRFVPTLRLYAFQPACLSLGRFQSSDGVDLDVCSRLGIDLVRRPSGGRAVLHDGCLTYALVAPADAPPFVGGVRASALRIGEALASGLRLLGADVSLAPPPARGRRPADCFAVPGAGEIVVGGRKLAGSAQVRRNGAALQHGTIRLRSDVGILARVLHEREDTSASTGPAAALDAFCHRPVTFTEAAQAVIAGFSAMFGVTLRGASVSSDEYERALLLKAARYGCTRWTLER